jgi:hypothetical protein
VLALAAVRESARRFFIAFSDVGAEVAELQLIAEFV